MVVGILKCNIQENAALVYQIRTIMGRYNVNHGFNSGNNIGESE